MPIASRGLRLHCNRQLIFSPKHPKTSTLFEPEFELLNLINFYLIPNDKVQRNLNFESIKLSPLFVGSKMETESSSTRQRLKFRLEQIK